MIGLAKRRIYIAGSENRKRNSSKGRTRSLSRKKTQKKSRKSRKVVELPMRPAKLKFLKEVAERMKLNKELAKKRRKKMQENKRKKKNKEN